MPAPKGRPSFSFSEALRLALASDPQKLNDLAEKLIALGAEGDLQALKEIADRLDGKATQQVNKKVELSATDAFVKLWSAMSDKSIAGEAVSSDEGGELRH